MVKAWNFMSYKREDLFWMSSLVLVYILLIKIIFSYIYAHGEASVIWLPSGVGLGVLLLFGRRYWLVIFIGTLLGYMLVLDRPLLSAASVALLSNTLEAIMAVWLLSKIHYRGKNFNANLQDSSDLIILSAAAVMSSLAAAIIGCMLLNIFDTFALNSLLIDTLHWWMGNVLGMLLVTPLILTWHKFIESWHGSYKHRLELIAYSHLLSFQAKSCLWAG